MQDIRKLVHDGVPSSNLYACDSEPSFLDLSDELFQDKETMKGHFFTADALDENGALDKLQGKIDIVYAASSLHVFGWDDQVKICKRIIKTLKPRRGSVVSGRQTGNPKGREVPNTPRVGKDSAMIRRHDVKSFAKLWNVADRAPGTKWKTWGDLDELEDMTTGHGGEDGLRRLRFQVERVE